MAGSKNLGTLTVDLIAKIGGFVDGMDKAQRQTQKSLDEIAKTAGELGLVIREQIGEKLLEVGEKIFDFFGEQIETIAKFQDAAEIVGDTAEHLSSLKLAADTSGTSIETLTAASVKLSVGLAAVDDSGTGAGAALNAIGINIKEFAKLSPVAQIEAVATAFSHYENGAGKTAVAVALFGKAGAELLPFLKNLGEQTDHVAALTNEQVEAANALSESFKGSKGDLQNLSSQFASDFIPTIADSVQVMHDFINEAGHLGSDTHESVAKFAQEFALGFASVIDYTATTLKTLNAFRGSFQVIFADLGIAAQFLTVGIFSKQARDDLSKSLDERNATVAEANQRYMDLLETNTHAVHDALEKQISDSAYTDLNKLFDDQKKKDIDFNTAKIKAAKDAADAAAKDAAAQVKMQQELADKLVDIEQKAQEAEVKKGVGVFDATRTDAEKLSIKLTELDQLLGEGVIDWVTYGRAIQQANDDLDEHTKHIADLQKDGKETFEQTRTDAEKYTAQLAKLKEQFDNGAIDSDTYKRAQKQAEDSINDLGKFADEAAKNMQDAFANFLFDPFKDGLKGLIVGFAQTLQKIAAEAAAAKIFSLIGGSVGGSFGGLFSAHADGSPLQTGWNLVGEQGPELIHSTGSVVDAPSTKKLLTSSNSGTTVHQTFNIQAPNGQVSKETMMQIAAKANSGVRAGARNL